MSRGFHFGWLLAAGLLANPGELWAQMPGEGTVSARSHSGQFIVRGQSVPSLPMRLLNLGTNGNYVYLEPTLLTVSSERVKQMVWRELGVSGAWQGRIYLELVPNRSPFDGVEIVASRFADGWQYRVQLPSMIERSRYMRGLVQAILMELANRGAGERLAEVPAWLSEGLAQQLVASGDSELIIPPPRLKQSDRPPAVFVMSKRENPLVQAHSILAKSDAALSFEDLCWPTSASLDGRAGEVYRSNAQVFFASLAGLREGRSSLRNMLESLPRFYNWQLAFFNAFQGYFARPLEVEKWWALRLLQFTGRDLGQTWPRDESLRKLAEALRVPVRVYESTNSLPTRTELTLQESVVTLDSQEQTRIVSGKLRELELVNLRIAPELAFLVDEYRIALQGYLQERPLGRTAPKSAPAKPALRRSAKNLSAKLDLLDQRLAQETASTPAAPEVDSRAAKPARF